MLRCADGECLSGTDHECDFETDCFDGSDEVDCPASICEKVCETYIISYEICSQVYPISR